MTPLFHNEASFLFSGAILSCNEVMRYPQRPANVSNPGNQCSVRANICNKKYCVYISCCPAGGVGDRQITLGNLCLRYLSLFYRYNS